MRRHLFLSFALVALIAPAASGQPAGKAEQERLRRTLQVNEADAAATRRDIEVLRRQLVQLAAVQASGERSSGGKRARLIYLNTVETELTGRLGRNRNTLARLLGALQLYRRDPPPALLVHPQSAKDAARAAILVRAMAPELQRRGALLSAEAAEIQRVRREVAAASEDLFSTESALADRRARIEELIAQKTALERSLRADAAAAEQALALLARGSSSVGELVSRLPPRAQIDLQSAPNAGLVAPVQGRVARRYGQASASGARSRGWTWAAQPGSMVRAPASGLIEYAGPLKGYGVILILRVGGGYHLILTGLEAAQAVAGSSVAAGEPIGRMAGERSDEVEESSAAQPSPELYLELRKEGAPVDPAPWLSPAVALR